MIVITHKNLNISMSIIDDMVLICKKGIIFTLISLPQNYL